MKAAENSSPAQRTDKDNKSTFLKDKFQTPSPFNKKKRTMTQAELHYLERMPILMRDLVEQVAKLTEEVKSLKNEIKNNKNEK